MSQVIIAGDTSGTITLQAPAVSGSSVLTLPATTATLATLTTPSFASTIGVGGATASASGAGISFPATQSASSDANTLDDYEEGTWTISDQSGAGISISRPTGYYTKIGSMVYFAFDIIFPSTSSTANVTLSLPFTCANLPAGGQVGGSFVTYTTTNSVITGGYPISNAAQLVYYKNNGSTLQNINISGAEFSASGFYRAAA